MLQIYFIIFLDFGHGSHGMVEEFLYEQHSKQFVQPQTFQMDRLLHEVHQLEQPPPHVQGHIFLRKLSTLIKHCIL